MSDALKRAIRSFLQAAVGTFAASNALSLANTDGVIHWDILQKAAISAFIAGVVALVSYAQNGLEDHTALPALLKPSLPSVPLTDAIEASAGHAVDALQDVAAAVKAAPKKKAPAKKAAPAKKVTK